MLGRIVPVDFFNAFVPSKEEAWNGGRVVHSEGAIMMATYSKRGSAEQNLKWAWIWFNKFSAFHGRDGTPERAYTAAEVISFLPNRRDAGVPAWKRMRVIEGLMVFRRDIQRRDEKGPGLKKGKSPCTFSSPDY